MYGLVVEWIDRWTYGWIDGGSPTSAELQRVCHCCTEKEPLFKDPLSSDHAVDGRD